LRGKAALAKSSTRGDAVEEASPPPRGGEPTHPRGLGSKTVALQGNKTREKVTLPSSGQNPYPSPLQQGGERDRYGRKSLTRKGPLVLNTRAKSGLLLKGGGGGEAESFTCFSPKAREGKGKDRHAKTAKEKNLALGFRGAQQSFLEGRRQGTSGS